MASRHKTRPDPKGKRIQRNAGLLQHGELLKESLGGAPGEKTIRQPLTCGEELQAEQH